jgi:hypothetical protein
MSKIQGVISLTFTAMIPTKGSSENHLNARTGFGTIFYRQPETFAMSIFGKRPGRLGLPEHTHQPFRIRVWLVLFATLVVCTQSTAAPPPSSGYHAGTGTDEAGLRYFHSSKTTKRLKIDGRLDEADWQQSDFQDNFLQREPRFGEPASERTEVAVLQSAQFLYIGIKCFDSQPDKIIAREMRRDERMENDDHFQIVFDTYRDHRNGFYFAVNPNGSMRDAAFGDEGQSYNPDWDGIWDCRTAKTGEGWFAEIAIPWKTLRFAQGDSAVWGVNFIRTIRRKNEEVYWQLVSRDAGRMGLFRLSEAGSLHGLTDLHTGGNLEAKPYVLGGAAKDLSTENSVASTRNMGIDAKIGLTPNLALNLTWNTDFAQVESDQEQVNLTRFSLYFPEKREFFLDGAEVFNFGGQSLSGRRGPGNGIRLFYSRRIGIVDGYQQPMAGGMKVLGKTGKYQVGMMNMLTKELNAIDIDEDEEIYSPRTNFTVFRLKRELFKRSYVGMILLNRQELRGSQYNRSGGIDANFPLTDKFTISGALAGTFGPDVTEDSETTNMKSKNLAGNLSVEYSSDLWDLEFSYLDVQENFNAEMGFMRRTDIRSTNAEIRFAPRPTNLPAIRQFWFRLQNEYLTDHGGRLLENQLSSSFGIRFQNSSFLFLGMQRIADFVDEDWEVRPGFVIPTSTYWGWQAYAFLSSDESKAISGGMRLNYGDYYTGTRISATPQLKLLNFDRFQTEVDVGFNHVELPGGSFDARTFGCRMLYFFSTKLYLKAYLQLNDDRKANDGDRISLANVLLRWIYRPGSDFYLVYNDGRLFGPGGMRISNRTLMLKTTFFWRK